MKNKQNMEKLLEVMKNIQSKNTGTAMLNPKDLKAWKVNFRNNEAQVDALAESISKEGYCSEFPLSVDIGTSEVISGVLRLQAVQKLGNIEAIPCVTYRELTEAEKMVIATDANKKNLKKSPLSVVNQLHALHTEHEFNYREIQYLTGISKTAICRKLKLLDVCDSLQELYEHERITDVDVERIIKDVKPEHQEVVASKMEELGKKVSKKQMELLLGTYRKATKEQADDEFKMPEISWDEFEQRKIREGLIEACDTIVSTMNVADYDFVDDPQTTVKMLRQMLSVTRTAIRRICSHNDIEDQVISAEEEQDILLKRALEEDEYPPANSEVAVVEIPSVEHETTSSSDFEKEKTEPQKVWISPLKALVDEIDTKNCLRNKDGMICVDGGKAPLIK